MCCLYAALISSVDAFSGTPSTSYKDSITPAQRCLTLVNQLIVVELSCHCISAKRLECRIINVDLVQHDSCTQGHRAAMVDISSSGIGATVSNSSSNESSSIIKAIIERDYTDMNKVRFFEACPVRIQPIVTGIMK